jgi:hypothetical protein
MRAELALALVLAGCGGFIDNQAASSTHRILLKATEAGRRQPDLELARDALPGGILQLETFALAYPKHRGFKVLHAESLCQYGVAFVFDDWEDASLGGRADEAKRLAGRLRGLLEACIDRNLTLLPASWRSARERGGDAFVAALPAATRDHVPALLWIATADAVLVATDPMNHLARLAPAIATLARCAELAPGFHDADAELLLGMLESARGGDGSASFAAARKALGEGALIADVMYARGTLVARRDRAGFERTLQAVLAADVAKWPERRLSNELARRKAQRYLAAIDTWF